MTNLSFSLLVGFGPKEGENSNQSECGQCKEWNCDKAKPIDIFCITRYTAVTRLDSANAWHFLLQVVKE
jgi:hypothetical protein